MAWLFPHRPWGLLGTGPKRLTMGRDQLLPVCAVSRAGRLLRKGWEHAGGREAAPGPGQGAGPLSHLAGAVPQGLDMARAAHWERALKAQFLRGPVQLPRPRREAWGSQGGTED